MSWGGRWEGGSGLGTHVRIKDFKILKNEKLIKKYFELLWNWESIGRKCQ